MNIIKIEAAKKIENALRSACKNTHVMLTGDILVEGMYVDAIPEGRSVRIELRGDWQDNSMPLFGIVDIGPGNQIIITQFTNCCDDGWKEDEYCTECDGGWNVILSQKIDWI